MTRLLGRRSLYTCLVVSFGQIPKQKKMVRLWDVRVFRACAPHRNAASRKALPCSLARRRLPDRLQKKMK